MFTELTVDRRVPGTSVDGVPLRRDRGRPAATVLAEGRRLAARRRSRGRGGSGGRHRGCSVRSAPRSQTRGRGYGTARRARSRTSSTFGADGVTPTTQHPGGWRCGSPHTGTPARPPAHHGNRGGPGRRAAAAGPRDRAGAARRTVTVLLAPLAAAGSMTLDPLHRPRRLHELAARRVRRVPGYLVQVVTALLFALAWRQAVGRGPLESTAKGGRAARRAAGGAGRSGDLTPGRRPRHRRNDRGVPEGWDLESPAWRRPGQRCAPSSWPAGVRRTVAPPR